MRSCIWKHLENCEVLYKLVNVICIFLRFRRQSIHRACYTQLSQVPRGLGAQEHSVPPQTPTCRSWLLTSHQHGTSVLLRLRRRHLDLNPSRVGPSLNHNTGLAVLCGWKVMDFVSHPNSPPEWLWAASVSSSGTFRDNGDVPTVFSALRGLSTEFRGNLFTSASCGCAGPTRTRWCRNGRRTRRGEWAYQDSEFQSGLCPMALGVLLTGLASSLAKNRLLEKTSLSNSQYQMLYLFIHSVHTYWVPTVCWQHAMY